MFRLIRDQGVAVKFVWKKNINHMAVETPEPQSSSWLCPQIQPWQKEVSYSWRDAGLYEHSFSLQSYGISSVAMGNGTYFR